MPPVIEKSGRLLKELNYNLLAIAKPLKELQYIRTVTRNESYIFNKIARFQQQKQPIVEVSTKKKETKGNYQNPGQEYRKKGTPRRMKVYDFICPLGKVAPYGVYDVTFFKALYSRNQP